MTTLAGQSTTNPDVYTQEFIDERVLRVIEGRRGRGAAYRSVRAVCRELDVPKTTLLRWVRRAESEAEATVLDLIVESDSVHDRGTSLDSAALGRRRASARFDGRITTLYRDNQRLVQENGVLRAALVLLARGEDTAA